MTHPLRSGVLFALAGLLGGCFTEFEGFQGDGPSGGGGTSGATNPGDVDTASGGAVTGGGEPGREQDCFDDADNDSDGLEDCGDPDCIDTVCLDLQVPGDGWEGPVVVFGGDAECPPNAPEPGLAGQVLVDPGNPCHCTCDSPTFGACSATLGLYSDEACTALSSTQTPDATCDTAGSLPATSAKLVATASGTCAPSAMNASPAFDADLRTCKLAEAGGCEDGEWCSRQLAGPVCFYKDGDQTCPGSFTSKRSVYRSLDGDLDCEASECACDTASGICGGSATLGNSGCPATGASVAADNVCHMLGGALTIESLVYIGSPSGQCPARPQPGVLEEFGDLATLCCKSL